MKKIAFSKMQALGNDFVIINAGQQGLTLEKARISQLADRHQGIGFDQLLVLSASSQADLCCRIFNADGSEAEHCGNGLRCVARFVHEEKLINKRELCIETKAGLIHLEIKDYEQILVNMGVPLIHPKPLLLQLDDFPVALTLLSLGNPHAIHRVKSCKQVPLTTWGAKIENHVAFPQGVNAGFMEVVDRESIYLRTYERGVGETLSCGSNACAAVVAGITHGWLDSRVKVVLAQGNLEVEWGGENQAVFLRGPAARVFSGELELSV